MSQLIANKLTVWRGPFCLLDELSFALGDGQVLLIRGSNGSGKTTLLRVLCGLTRPEEGQVTWDGVPIDPHRQAFGAALAYFGHTLGLKADLTIRQNLDFSTRLYGHPGLDLADVLGALNLSDCANLEVRYLSAGQQRRTALARVLTSGARLWILDEPFTNLDAAGRAYAESRLNAHLGGGGLAAVAAHHDLSIPDGTIIALRLGDVH